MTDTTTITPTTSRKALVAIWMPARDGGDGYDPIPAHAEAWKYEGGRTGEYIADLPGWTREDCAS